MRFSLPAIVSFLAISFCAFGSEPLRVGFYNVENLYDTINQPSVDDGDFTPDGRKKWDSRKYLSKLSNLSKAISSFSPDILGLCEIENYGVATDLARQTRNLHGVIHYDSRDSRGIDVALIYDTSRFHLVQSEPIFVSPMRRNFLRSRLLEAKSGREFIIYVVHLPSKLGGSGARTRRYAAHLAIDSLVRLEKADAKIIVMGDFNDSPTKIGKLHNCALSPFSRGEGSYAYRDLWDMIDQIHISPSLLPYADKEQSVVRTKGLVKASGRYKGYPRKGTISDHLPIFIDIE